MISKRRLVVVKREVEEERRSELGRRFRNVLLPMLLLVLPRLWFGSKSQSANSMNFGAITQHLPYVSGEEGARLTSPAEAIVDKDDSSSLSSRPSSPVCRPKLPSHPVKRIVFGHMRKAGGTNIRHYLNEVFRKRHPHVEVVQFEGGNIEEPMLRNDTLYVTHLRDPVSRTLSHFKYSERWPCRWLTGVGPNIPANWTPTAENASTLSDFLRESSRCNLYRRRLYQCAQNCYVASLYSRQTYIVPMPEL